MKNDALSAQPRPSLALSKFEQPEDGYNARAARVVNLSQATLDEDLWGANASKQDAKDFTTLGYGLLTDVVQGGLKTDMNLGFELSDGDFNLAAWDGRPNPFLAAGVTDFSVPSAYDGQRPLFKPISENGSVDVTFTFPQANVRTQFPNAAVPTFTTLRSFYRTPHHLYDTAAGPTVFQRSADHVSFVKPTPSSGQFYAPGATPPGDDSHVGFTPVLDRVFFILGVGVSSGNEVRLTFTPIISLWNPYNTAMEIEGAVAYPWIDLPFSLRWNVKSSTTNSSVAGFPKNLSLSRLMGHQLRSVNHGRSVDPYFYASITSGGNGVVGSPIRFEPGEVRVFAPATTTNTEYKRDGTDRERMVMMAPVTNPNQLSTNGGLSVSTENKGEDDAWTHVLKSTETVQLTVRSAGDQFPFFIGLEDASRLKLSPSQTSSTRNAPVGQFLGDVQAIAFGKAVQQMDSPHLSLSQISNEPRAFGVIECYHRVARDIPGTQNSNLVFTVNPRQPHINAFMNRGTFQSGPNYQTSSRPISGLSDVIQTSDGGRTSFYGATNAPGEGRTHLSFFEIPREPMLSLAAFQHADLSFTACSPASQVGNSWANVYLTSEKVGQLDGQGANPTFSRDLLTNYDTSLLCNEALWDSFFFSSAAPVIEPGTTGGSPAVWTNPVGNITQSLKATLDAFIQDPAASPLRNTRMRFHAGGADRTVLADELLEPEGCTRIGAHLMVDGAFNVNSTSIPAWEALLSGLRGVDFDVTDGTLPAADASAQPRMRNPLGDPNDPWQGFRALSEAEVKILAENIVEEVRLRGPFLSLAEFVNRRPAPVGPGSDPKGEIGLKGALQAVIDRTNINDGMLFDTFGTSQYPGSAAVNASPPRTGVGIPGYLTQADLLQSIAPVITTRSDTFTVRGYGEAHDKNGNVISTACCEAVVQRYPEFVDESQPAHTAIADLNAVNGKFGRRFGIVSFRYLTAAELALLS